MTVAIPPVAAGIEVRPDTGDDSIWRLVAVWLLGYESPATLRNYGLDLAAWLDFWIATASIPWKHGSWWAWMSWIH